MTNGCKPREIRLSGIWPTFMVDSLALRTVLYKDRLNQKRKYLMTIKQTFEVRALVAVVSAAKGILHLQPEVARPLQDAAAAANAQLESIFRAQAGYYLGDTVMHGVRGPFRVEDLVPAKGGVQVMLRRVNVDGSLSKKQTWEWLIAHLTPVTP